MCMMCCGKCGWVINTDDNPESFYLVTSDDKEITLDEPLCPSCMEVAVMEAERRIHLS